MEKSRILIIAMEGEKQKLCTGDVAQLIYVCLCARGAPANLVMALSRSQSRMHV